MLRNSVIGVFALITLLVAVNLVWLDIMMFSKKADSQVAKTELSVVCDDSCREAIQADVISTLNVPSEPPKKDTSQAMEYYVPLGSGTTRSNEYVALDGAEAYIDTSLYGQIKQVTFEVFLRNPTGNGVTSAKLFNVTDKHDVWFSEVTFEGGGLSRQDAKVTLEPGNKLYRVYLKSSLAYDVYVDNARLHIITQ